MSLQKSLLQICILMISVTFSGVSRADRNCTYDIRTVEYAKCKAAEFSDDLTILKPQLEQNVQRALQNIPRHFVVSESGKELVDDTEQIKSHFSKAQSAWKEYTIETCAYEGQYRGNSITLTEMFTNRCLVREFSARIAVLNNMKPPQQDFP